MIWVVPLPSNSHHKDYQIFSRGSRTKPSFATVTGRRDYQNSAIPYYITLKNQGWIMKFQPRPRLAERPLCSRLESIVQNDKSSGALKPKSCALSQNGYRTALGVTVKHVDVAKKVVKSIYLANVFF